MLFALISVTPSVKPSDLYAMVPAVERGLGDVCTAYQITERPGVMVCDDERKLPENCYPMVCVEETDRPGTLGYHFFDRGNERPAARILVNNMSGFNSGPNSLIETLTHETHEALVSPSANTWHTHPVRRAFNPRHTIKVANECGDPCQDTYRIRVSGTDWQVTNFVTPFWYMPAYLNPREVRSLIKNYGYGVDWCGRLSAAGEIGFEGYAIFREEDERGRVVRSWSEDSMGELMRDSAKLTRKQHHASRTSKLGGVPT